MSHVTILRRKQTPVTHHLIDAKGQQLPDVYEQNGCKTNLGKENNDRGERDINPVSTCRITQLHSHQKGEKRENYRTTSSVTGKNN